MMVNPITNASTATQPAAPAAPAAASAAQPAPSDVQAFDAALGAGSGDDEVLAQIQKGIQDQVFRDIQKLNREHARRMKENAQGT